MSGPGCAPTGGVPRIFQVNWFRKGDDGQYLWPGFGDNGRVLAWILDRVEGRAAAVDSPVGWLPAPGAIDLDGADVSDADWQELFRIDPAAHLARGRRRGGVLRRVRRPRPRRGARPARRSCAPA